MMQGGRPEPEAVDPRAAMMMMGGNIDPRQAIMMGNMDPRAGMANGSSEVAPKMDPRAAMMDPRAAMMDPRAAMMAAGAQQEMPQRPSWMGA